MAEGKAGAGARVGAGGRIPQPTPPTPPSPRAPPARRPASLPGAVSHAPFVSATLCLGLSFCPSPLLPEERPSGWNLPLPRIQKGSRPLHPRGTQPLSLPQPPPPPSQNNSTAPGRSGENNNLEGSALYRVGCVERLDYLCEVGGAELKEPHCRDEETEARGGPVTRPRSQRESGRTRKPNSGCSTPTPGVSCYSLLDPLLLSGAWWKARIRRGGLHLVPS